MSPRVDPLDAAGVFFAELLMKDPEKADECFYALMMLLNDCSKATLTSAIRGIEHALTNIMEETEDDGTKN